MKFIELLKILAFLLCFGAFCYGGSELPQALDAGRVLYSGSEKDISLKCENLVIQKNAGKLRFRSITEMGDAPDLQLGFSADDLGIVSTVTIYKAPEGTVGPKVVLDEKGSPKLAASRSNNPYGVFELSDPSETFSTEFKRVIKVIAENFPMELANTDGKPMRRLTVPGNIKDSPIVYVAKFNGTGEFRDQKLKNVPWIWVVCLGVVGNHYVKINLDGPSNPETLAADMDISKAIAWLPKITEPITPLNRQEPTLSRAVSNGQGTLTLQDGWKYVGDVKDGVPNGQGTLTFPDGETYVGRIKDGMPNGQGTRIFPNGMQYFGEFKNNVLNGPGTVSFSDGTKWVGEFKNGTFLKSAWPGGQSYVGGYKDGRREGQGTLTSTDGMKYVGQFKDNKREGQGRVTLPNGQKYVGEWKDNLPSGQGTETLPSGEEYVGTFEDGKRCGPGTVTWPDGRKYVGDFKDGKMHGPGTLTYPDGRKEVGEFKEDKWVEALAKPRVALKPGTEI